MLVLPDSGMSRSTTKNNIKSDILCDWIEGSILFDENQDEFSIMDVVDILIDENICVEQDFARGIVVDAWNELKRRLNWIDTGTPFSITHSRVKRIDSWHETPAHSFCVLLSLSQCYKGWWRSVSGQNFTEQGELFELLTQESLQKQFSDWQVKRVGWSPNQPISFAKMINMIADHLGETTSNNLDQKTPSKVKDAGLDLLWFRPFPDKRVGFPVYFMQCASGQDWTTKVDKPKINRWRQYIEFIVLPQKAFAIPFALGDKDFKNWCGEVEGVFLDRYRLLGASRFCKQWESSSLKKRIIEWAIPKVNQLPLY